VVDAEGSSLGEVAMSGWILFCSVLVSVLLSSAPTQSGNNAIGPLEHEITKWSVLTYTQRYIDDHNERVVYHGTLFLQLSKVSLNGCDLELSVRVQDKFTGTVTKVGFSKVDTTFIGQTSQTFSYRYSMSLKDVQEVIVTALDSRPAQLPSETGYNCDEEPACKISWLDVKLPKALIRATRETDGLVDFDKKVSEIAVPISSRQAAHTAGTTLEELIVACQSKDRP
jgi:hypothetical protein